jgi:predicted metalloprotease
MVGGGEVVEAPAADAPVQDAREEPTVLFLSAVLDSTQSYWQRTLPSLGTQYQRARLVLFRDATQTACGFGEAAAGPFYCPGDGKVYVDLSFLEELDRRFGAPGDFAQAYVLAHEIGHHVQNVLGISEQVHRAQQQNRGAANELSVRLELQADCYAGVWGHVAAQQGMLERGDVEEGLTAAAAVGDDRIQRQATGRVNPESWTHGSSAQRMQWFRRGFDGGDPRACETFTR